jgi:organic radical activating enzyme
MGYKQLRLLLFEECDRSCVGCCNGHWDLKNLPVCGDYSPYDLIMLTGGEPLLRPHMTLDMIQRIRSQSKARIIVYTAKLKPFGAAMDVLVAADGMTVTLHEPSDLPVWRDFAYLVGDLSQNRSLRLNVFEDIELARTDYRPGWAMKTGIRWVPNCPLPEGEVFMRIEED